METSLFPQNPLILHYKLLYYIIIRMILLLITCNPPCWGVYESVNRDVSAPSPRIMCSGPVQFFCTCAFSRFKQQRGRIPQMMLQQIKFDECWWERWSICPTPDIIPGLFPNPEPSLEATQWVSDYTDTGGIRSPSSEWWLFEGSSSVPALLLPQVPSSLIEMSLIIYWTWTLHVLVKVEVARLKNVSTDLD